MSDNTSANDTMTGNDESAKERDQAALALKSSVLGEAHHLGDGVKNLASDVAEQTRKIAESQIASQKSNAAKQLGGVANALRKTGENLRAENNDTFTDYLDTAAEKVDSAAGYLKTRSLADVVSDVEGFARREPALFIGGALVLGLLGGRFLKSTRPSQHSNSQAGANSRRNAEQSGAKPPQKLALNLSQEFQRDEESKAPASSHGTPSQRKTLAFGNDAAKDENGAQDSNGTKGHGGV